MNSNDFPQKPGFPQEPGPTYGAVSRILHWLTALGVFVMLGLGWGREFAPGPWKPFLTELHKSLGLCLLAVVIIRLGWRVYAKAPALPSGTPLFIAWAAKAAHGALYALIVLMPLSGWAMVSAMGREASFFGVFNLPALFERTPSLVPALKEAHELAAFLLAGLIALHIGAALYHQFILKDNLLAQMWPDT